MTATRKYQRRVHLRFRRGRATLSDSKGYREDRGGGTKREQPWFKMLDLSAIDYGNALNLLKTQQEEEGKRDARNRGKQTIELNLRSAFFPSPCLHVINQVSRLTSLRRRSWKTRNSSFAWAFRSLKIRGRNIPVGMAPFIPIIAFLRSYNWKTCN